MKLTNASKKKLLDSAQAVYLAYTALDFFKTRTFNTAFGELSLYELCEQALSSKNYEQFIVINDVNYQLRLTPETNNTFKVQLSRPINSPTDSVVKKIADYKDEEVLNLLANQQFTLETPAAGVKPVVANRINEHYVIGGPGKVDLYRTHLVTLHNIIAKIKSEEDISSLLVALATGTGKTFVQALWMMILSLSDNNGVFAIPGNLLSQFAKDLKRVLPDNLVNKIVLLREQEQDPQTRNVIQSMAKPEGSNIVIGSAEHLLDSHYQEMMEADSSRTFLSFDEQHLIMKSERRRVRLIELAKQKLSMFLTATPNKETYELSGNKPVAIMSSGQKQQAGQGQFPQLFTHQARTVSDKNKFKDFRFWTGDFWSTALNGLLLSLSNSIQEEQSSAAQSLVEDLPFYYYRKENETNVRWRLQVPAARKMLCLIDDNEDLVNFCNTLEDYNYRSNVYRNGNLVDRSDVSQFFGIPDAEVDVIYKDRDEKRANYLDSLENDERKIGERLANKNLKQQLKDNIFHNLVEYVLTDITGLDEIEHNRLRKKDMGAFKQLVVSQFASRSAEYYQAKLAKDLDAQGAQVLGELLADLSTVMQRMIDGTFVYRRSWWGNPWSDGDDDTAADYEEENQQKLTDFIDNWALYDGLMEEILESNYELSRAFNTYANSHLIMGVMTGMNDAETPVEESRPFSGLAKDRYNLYDNNGTLVNRAKKRKRTSLEILNDTSTETAFTPNYLNITEEMADNYVRLGFVGVYVSNKKTEGFSDRNLHTVINIAEHKLSANNSPETQIQGIGRNRGLDDTIVPAYVHSLGRNEQALFDLEHLQSDDYYPELFKSQEQYNQEYIEILGQNVSKKIIAWIHENQDGDDAINPDHLKRQVLKYIAQALRALNNKNSHQIELSRAQLTKVVGYVMDGINKEIEHINKPYTVSTFISLLGSFLNFLAECYYAFKRIPAAWNMFKFSWFGTRTADQSTVAEKHADDVYIKILSKTSYKDIISKMSSGLEFKNWLSRKAKGVETHIAKNLDSYVKKEVLDSFAIHQKKCIEPLLIKMVVDSKKEQVTAALAAFPHLISLFKANANTLSTLSSRNDEQLKAIMLGLLKQVPGLEDLVIDDIVNYPKNMLHIQALLTTEPEQVLLVEPAFQKELSIQLGNYLKGDFLMHLSAFMSYPNAKRVGQILGEEQNAALFVQHCINKVVNKELSFSPETIFAELNRYFHLEDCETLDKDVEALSMEINALHLETSGNIVQSLNDTYITELATLIKQQLIPVLVNAYPLERRAELFHEASALVRIKKLIKEHGSELYAAAQNNRAALPDFVLSRLCSSPLPEPINITKKAEESTAFLIKGFNDIMQKSIPGLLLGKLFSPSSWSLKKEYLYDTAVVEFLNSDGFLNAISLMLPYNQWVQLKARIHQDHAGVLSIARHLIDKGSAGELSELSAEYLLNLFNEQFKTQYHGAEQVAEQASQSFDQFAKKISDNSLTSLAPSIQSKYAQLVSRRLLPILASFIDDDAKKEQLLSVERDDKTLVEFIARNTELLTTFNNQGDEQIKHTVLALINQLQSEGAKLVLADMVNSQVKATNSSEIMVKDLQKISLTAFINSSTFSGLMNDVLNAEDFTLLMNYIHVPEQVSLLVDTMMAKDVSSLDQDSILKIIRASDASLNAVATMDERIASLKDYFDSQKEHAKDILDKTKITQHLGDAISPVIFHQQFIGVIEEIIGFLDEQDLAILFEAMGKEKPAEDAKQFSGFIDMIRRQDKSVLMNHYLTFSKEDNSLDVERLPMKNMIDLLQDLFEEVLDCHCYYHQQDRKALEGRGQAPKIINKLSEELRDIQVASDYSFLSGFSRKIFYIQSINNGIADAGQINADSNQHIVKSLQRVNSHILRPLWWSTNVSSTTHGFVKFCRNVVEGIVAGYFAVLNGIKSMLNFIIGSDYFNVSSKHSDSDDYSETAFDYAAAINELEPLNAEQVKETNCQPDVVVNLEEFVAKRSSRPGFFRDVGDTLPVETEVESASPRFNG